MAADAKRATRLREQESVARDCRGIAFPPPIVGDPWMALDDFTLLIDRARALHEITTAGAWELVSPHTPEYFANQLRRLCCAMDAVERYLGDLSGAFSQFKTIASEPLRSADS